MNQSEIAAEVLGTIRFDLRNQLTSAFLRHLDCAPQAALTEGYGPLLERLAEILLRRFPALVDIALHDPTCADPAEWASEFSRIVLHEVMDRKCVLEGDHILDQSIINIVVNRHQTEDDDPYAVMTDFHVQMDYVLGEAVRKAKLQLARHSWKEGGSWEPAESKAVEAVTESNTRTAAPSRCPYTLEDLEEREDRNRKVLKFYPYLKEAVRHGRRIYDENQKRRRSTRTQEIEERIPLLKQATKSEHAIIRDRKLTLRNATIQVIMKRTALDYQTICRYVAGTTRRK